jgi:hypothetical protein
MDDKYNLRKSRKGGTSDFGFAILDFGLKKERLLAETGRSGGDNEAFCAV